MLLVNCVIILTLLVSLSYTQILQNARFRRFPMKAAAQLKIRLREKLNQYRERNTKSVCYETVGCFNLPHKNSPLQKVPEDPKELDTKFFLFTRKINFSHPEILYYDDDGVSLQRSSFNFSNPLKLMVHGYMGNWNLKGLLAAANAYLKLYDCNVILMNWHKGARGPKYANAVANTELVGRQLGILLIKMADKGLDAGNMHLIGFSLGAHVCGTASESLKAKGYLLGRITGLDAASPLFRINYLREKYKKLDRSDAKFVDVIHTDSSPYVTDGFGLWEPIGHVDFFPNGGQEQPGCADIKSSIVVSHLEGNTLTPDSACSHIRSFQLFLESLLNLVVKKLGGIETCEFIAFSCPGGLPSFEKGHCFPHLDSENSSLALDAGYRSDIGKFGENAKGEGVMYFSTKDTLQYCGTQLQASVQLSQRTGHTKGILQLQLYYINYTVNFQIKCETSDFIMTGARMNGLSVADYNTLSKNVDNVTARLSYMDLEKQDDMKNRTNYSSILYIDKIIVRDMYGNSWQYCKKDTVLQDNTRKYYDLLNVTLSRTLC